ncbi:hypothetical protein [Paractinoplanes deccanensis]|nr:hypothetical protein [Actinoplanes deccanensis]
MRFHTTVVLAVVPMVFAAGCSGNDATEPAAQQQPAAAPASAVAPATTAAKPATATAIIEKLGKAQLGLTGVVTQTEDTDPNNLLGRPNGYTSRASADLPGGDAAGERGSIDRGLVVEVFDTADLAQRRSDYIQGLQKDNPLLGSEWHYRTADGTGLVRVSGKVKPSLAKKIQAAVSS